MTSSDRPSPELLALQQAVASRFSLVREARAVTALGLAYSDLGTSRLLRGDRKSVV